jgi:hypothetical protein
MTNVNPDIKKPRIGLIIVALLGLLGLIWFLAYKDSVFGPLFLVSLYFLGVWLLCVGWWCGIIAALIGAPKGQGWLGFLLGALLGPLGILIMVFTQGNRKICPYCKEKIHKDASVCSRCQKEQISEDKSTQGNKSGTELD